VALAPGTRLGSYEVLTLIGRGGMGEVYRARDARLARDVAIKVLPSEVAGDPDRLARFEREAQVLASLNHPNIAHIHGVDDSAGVPALIMELVEGPTLADRIAKGPIPLDEALSIAKQIVEALEAAHGQGIIHRDLKPANIKLRPDGAVKVLDFGLARQIAGAGDETRPSDRVTASGTILGTLHYLPPEVLRGQPADARADVWAIGVVLYELGSGRLPFDGTTSAAISAAILTTPLPSLPGTVPAALRAVIAKCLAKPPGERFQTVTDLRTALADVIRPPSPVAWWASWRLAAAALVIIGIVIGLTMWRSSAAVSERRTSTGAPASISQEANDAFELAMNAQRVQNDIPRATQMLERALTLDPHFAEAHRYHAFNRVITIANGYASDAAMLYDAEAELREAEREDPSLPSLPSAFAAVYLMQGRRELVPIAALDRIVAQNPTHRDSLLWRAIVAWLEEDNQKVKALIKPALERDPLFAPGRMFLGETLRSEGDTAGAIREQQKVLDQAPGNISAVRDLTMAYLDGGDLEHAEQLVETKREMFAGNYSWRATRALLFAREGRREAALAAMDEETLKYLRIAFPSTLDGAEFYALLGSIDTAIEFVERAVRNGDERILWFQRNPRLAALRSDPRFQRIIDSVHARRAERRSRR
jgi:tetratricopeptide (TPR) repeat protein